MLMYEEYSKSKGRSIVKNIFVRNSYSQTVARQNIVSIVRRGNSRLFNDFIGLNTEFATLLFITYICVVIFKVSTPLSSLFFIHYSSPTNKT